MPAAREIGARESRSTVRSRLVHTHAISRAAAENASGPGLTVRLLSRCEPPAAGPPPAGGDERGSTPRKSLRLATTATERYSDGPVETLAAGPERADEGGGPDAGAASRGTTC